VCASVHGTAGFGRRKSWVVPTQLMIALLLFAAAPRIDGWLAPVRASPWAV
jgi:hypothetical protein